MVRSVWTSGGRPTPAPGWMSRSRRAPGACCVVTAGYGASRWMTVCCASVRSTPRLMTGVADVRHHGGMPDDSSSDHLTAMSIAAYSAAADTFDDPVLSFWDRFGRETVRRVGLHPGDRVLDACCGTGASALPAAQAVGGEGSVLGVDIAEPALALARAKAAALGLSNVEFRINDVANTGLPSASFDAVVC